jgi:hypothetical protein
VSVSCPYCGERLQVLLDPAEIGQRYTEDCQVCCAPILFDLYGEDDDLCVSVSREDDG